jgi:predicted pyridoxine 5'-phosphate oxidase superfamily flavin-nucleotide-binding protein
MTYGFMDIALTPNVRAAQAEMGADRLWTDFKGHREFDRFTEQETAFIAQQDTFFLASVSETGWPYVQHRGGPAGFLKTIDDRTLAFADFQGNRQYISTGTCGPTTEFA